MIISGGVNIYPAEIEAVLLRAPAGPRRRRVRHPRRRVGRARARDRAGRSRARRSISTSCARSSSARLAGYKRPRDVRAARRAAAHRLGQAAEARAARRVLVGPGLARSEPVRSTCRAPCPRPSRSALLARVRRPVRRRAPRRRRRRPRSRAADALGYPGRRQAVRRRDRAQDRARARAARAARRRRRSRAAATELLAAARPDDGDGRRARRADGARHPRADRRAACATRSSGRA